MLTKQQADYLREQFKRATEYVWNEEKQELIPTPIALDVLENIIAGYQIEATEELDCPDLPTHCYLRGIDDAVITAKCAVSDYLAENRPTMPEDLAECMTQIAEAIDDEIELMLDGD